MKWHNFNDWGIFYTASKNFYYHAITSLHCPRLCCHIESYSCATVFLTDYHTILHKTLTKLNNIKLGQKQNEYIAFTLKYKTGCTNGLAWLCWCYSMQFLRTGVLKSQGFKENNNILNKKYKSIKYRTFQPQRV